MIHLLDVNVLVALFDAGHVHHDAAHDWFSSAKEDGWATCPTTENGFVRVVSNPAYPGRRTRVSDAVTRLGQFSEGGGHTYWPDDISILHGGLFAPSHLAGHREVTDVYLLGLAVHHDGTLATFDRSIRTSAVPESSPEHLLVLPTGT